jgi:hypothetical protein
MYNRFNVRDEVYDPYGYAKPPFILRGIQREGSSDPQRWGLGGTTAGVVSGLLDIPRGGPLTAGERAAVDVARIGKFLIRPNGLAFIAKQQLLHLMQPNTEDVFGNVNKLNPQKVYNPANTLLTVAGGGLGLRFRRYGLLPTGGLSRYEDIHIARGIGDSILPVLSNRLVKMLNETVDKPLNALGADLPLINNALQLTPTLISVNKDIPIVSKLPIGSTWQTLSGLTGPDSVGGIGRTNFTRYVDTSISNQINTHYGFIKNYGDAVSISYRTTTVDKPYIGERKNEEISNDSVTTTESERSNLNLKLGRSTYTGGISEDQTPAIAKYKTLAYGQIPKRDGRVTTILDFKTGTEYDVNNVPMKRFIDTSKDKTLESRKNTDTESLVTFNIAGVTLLAYLTSLNEVASANTSPVQALAVYPTYMYDTYDRTVNCSLMIAARSKAELAANWDKIKNLQNKLLPSRTNTFWRPQAVTITIGDVYKNRRVIFESLSFDIDTESPWEISENQQVPFYISVDMGFRVVSLDGAEFSGFSVNTSNIR